MLEEFLIRRSRIKAEARPKKRKGKEGGERGERGDEKENEEKELEKKVTDNKMCLLITCCASSSALLYVLLCGLSSFAQLVPQ